MLIAQHIAYVKFSKLFSVNCFYGDVEYCACGGVEFLRILQMNNKFTFPWRYCIEEISDIWPFENFLRISGEIKDVKLFVEVFELLSQMQFSDVAAVELFTMALLRDELKAKGNENGKWKVKSEENSKTSPRKRSSFFISLASFAHSCRLQRKCCRLEWYSAMLRIRWHIFVQHPRSSENMKTNQQ